jgi:hypothetical protein
VKNIVDMRTANQEEILADVLEAVETTDLMDLVVFNDDVNTFDHVIHTLIRVCEHTPEQAEQCTLIIRESALLKKGPLTFFGRCARQFVKLESTPGSYNRV